MTLVSLLVGAALASNPSTAHGDLTVNADGKILPVVEVQAGTSFAGPRASGSGGNGGGDDGNGGGSDGDDGSNSGDDGSGTGDDASTDDEASEEEDKGGCSTLGAAPTAFGLLIGFGAALRRREN